VKFQQKKETVKVAVTFRALFLLSELLPAPRVGGGPRDGRGAPFLGGEAKARTAGWSPLCDVTDGVRRQRGAGAKARGSSGCELGFLPSEPGRRRRTLGLVCSLFFLLFFPFFSSFFFLFLVISRPGEEASHRVRLGFSSRRLSGCRVWLLGCFRAGKPRVVAFARRRCWRRRPCARSFASRQPSPRRPALGWVTSVASTWFLAPEAREEAGLGRRRASGSAVPGSRSWRSGVAVPGLDGGSVRAEGSFLPTADPLRAVRGRGAQPWHPRCRLNPGPHVSEPGQHFSPECWRLLFAAPKSPFTR